MNTETQDTSTANESWMHLGDSSLAEGARKHIDVKLKKEASWSSYFLCKSSKKERYRNDEVETAEDRGEPIQQSTLSDPLKIEFGDKRTNKDSDCTSDQFKWAVLYENQRGLVFFSTPYFSSRSLLPQDPPAFTPPDTGGSTQPERTHPDAESSEPSNNRISRNITLETYVLPDPTWRWVSSSWFVDMRGDGEVQHDGFEYNWSFKSKKWRSKVGWFSAGGLVRRRRWVRLMVRPSDAHLTAEAVAKQRDFEDKVGESLIPTYESSDVPLWRGDKSDWYRLRKILKVVAIDGPKLELWKAWLADMLSDPEKPKCKSPEVSEDHIVVVTNENHQLPNERPSREWVLSILKEHGKDFRHVFIYPDSRARFGTLLLEAGLLQEILPDAPDDETRIATVLGPADFWNQTV